MAKLIYHEEMLTSYIAGYDKTKIGGKDLNLINPQTGELERYYQPTEKHQPKDKQRFIKMYVEINQERNFIKVLFQLNATAQKIFEFALYAYIQEAKDTTEFYWNYKHAKLFGYPGTERNYYKGMKLLKDSDLMRKSSRNAIWEMNPLYLFNGDKLKYINQQKGMH